MPYVKSRFKKDILPILLGSSGSDITEGQGGCKVKFLHLQKAKHSNTGQKVNTIRVSYGNK